MLPAFSAAQIIEIVQPVRALGRTDATIVGIAPLDAAAPGDLSFLGNPKYKGDVARSRASILLLPTDFEGEPPAGQLWLLLDKPSSGLTRLCSRIERLLWPKPAPGIHPSAVIAADASTGRKIALAIGSLALVLAHASIEAGRGWLAADGRLRSALRAWWRGLRLLAKRPVAVLAVYLLTTLLALAFAAAMLALRQRIGVSGTGGFLLALLAGGLVPAALAWGRIARLSGMQALAQDAHARR